MVYPVLFDFPHLLRHVNRCTLEGKLIDFPGHILTLACPMIELGEFFFHKLCALIEGVSYSKRNLILHFEFLVQIPSFNTYDWFWQSLILQSFLAVGLVAIPLPMHHIGCNVWAGVFFFWLCLCLCELGGCWWCGFQLLLQMSVFFSVMRKVSAVGCERWSVLGGIWRVMCDVWGVRGEGWGLRCHVSGLRCEMCSMRYEMWMVDGEVWCRSLKSWVTHRTDHPKETTEIGWHSLMPRL